jgi:ribokinase
LILNFGSINIDNVYRVAQLVTAGETISAKSFDRFLGGKGVNQSIAIHRAKGGVKHVGHIGHDVWISEQLKSMDIDLDFITETDHATGHAIISVDDAGENQIVIFSGANLAFSLSACEKILAQFAGDASWIVLQNEINLSADLARMAKVMGYKVCYSAAPFDAAKVHEILPFVDLLALNETEFGDLQKATGMDASTLGIEMVLVTLGAKGAKLHIGDDVISQNSFPVTPVDTTGAGDTFLGSFIARFDAGNDAATSLRYASAASAIQVTRMGAAPAIPSEADVLEFLESHT